MSKLTIGKLAKEAKVGVETVRFYERKGLIQRPKRNGSQFREYDPDNIRRIRFIKRTQEVGFTLKEVKDLLGLRVSSRATCGDVRKRTDKKLLEIERKISDLKEMKRSLKKLSDACFEKKTSTSNCPILECFEGECFEGGGKC